MFPAAPAIMSEIYKLCECLHKLKCRSSLTQPLSGRVARTQRLESEPICSSRLASDAWVDCDFCRHHDSCAIPVTSLSALITVGINQSIFVLNLAIRTLTNLTKITILDI
jgi:hypothetical protein